MSATTCPLPFAIFLAFALAAAACNLSDPLTGVPTSGCEEGEDCSNDSNDPNNASNDSNTTNSCVGDDCTCEPEVCSDSDLCTLDTSQFDPGSCQTLCSYTPITECVDGDGCCPSDCTGGDDDDCECDPAACPAGNVCLDSGACGEPTDCSQLSCGAQVCDPATVSCVDACNVSSCRPNEVCNPETRLCEVFNCPDEDPNQCDGTALPLWDPVTCICAECLDDSGCDQAAGEVCTAGGRCFACQRACSASTPGTCVGAAPYCVDDCCRECIGSADCARGEVCKQGLCVDPPNCTADPAVCPTAYVCNLGSGECEPPMTGQTCNPADPSTCPRGSFCDPVTATCAAGGGGVGCGFCNPDCTCPAGFTCNNFYCTSPDPTACLNCPSDPTVCALTFLDNDVVCLP